jgi:hypothetical protein
VSHFINSPYQIDSVIPHELYPPLLYHGLTGEVPVVIHFNGEKLLRDEWWGKLWWNKVQHEDDKFLNIVRNKLKEAAVVIKDGGSFVQRKLLAYELFTICRCLCKYYRY